MGWFSNFRFARDVATSPAPAFEGNVVDADAIDPAVFGLTAYAEPTSIAPKVTRKQARQVPAVKRGRDLICGTLGGLPIDLIGPDQTPAVSSLFDQPERNVPRSVTMIKTFEDLFYDERAWWRVDELGWHGYPVFVTRLDVGRVYLDERTGAVYVDGVETPPEKLIRFDSPNDGILTAGARAIRTALHLDVGASNGAQGLPPVDYFTPADGLDGDPADDDEVTQILDDWAEARREGRTGYVPAALKYNTAGWNPEQLQLADQRNHAVLELSRVIGLDPEDLGVSVTSRVYANAETRRRDLLDFTLSAYLIAVADRLKMGDVTPRGYYAKFNLDAFLRSDTLQRYQAYEVGLRVGAVSREEIRILEDRPPLPETTDAPSQETPAVTAPTEPLALPPAASADLHLVNFQGLPPTFDATEPVYRLDAPGAEVFEVDRETRTIRGLVVPFGVIGKSRGRKFRFSRDSLTWATPERVKLWIQHDHLRATGHAFELEARDLPVPGLYAAVKVARGALGDQALSMAEDKVWDGFSVGLGDGGTYTPVGDVLEPVGVPLMEISLTPVPSFDDARVHAVAASAAPTTEKGHNMKCKKCGHDHAHGVVECQPDHLAAFAAGQQAATMEAPAGAADFSPITDAIAAGFATMANPQGAPAPVSTREVVGNGGVTSVTEELPYRFDGIAGARCFSDDLRAAFEGNGEAKQILDGFLAEAFAVTTTNTATLNPTQNRPELYVPQLAYSTPLWDLVSTGSIDDKTAFTIPKFSSASGLVGTHTEGTEPTPGAFAATSQTVTPVAISGKVEINREVWDQGGNPQSDGIIWAEMLNAWAEAREARIAAVLAAVGTAELNLASAVDAALVDALTAYFAGLQFVRGGNRFTAFASDGNLFPALVDAADSTGRKLLPVLGPQNAQGTVGGAFDRVSLGNQEIRAAWALGTGNDKKSYNFVPTSVWAWASTPKRFTFEYQVKSVDMAIWGYAAAAVTRDSDVKPIDYTTSDTP